MAFLPHRRRRHTRCVWWKILVNLCSNWRQWTGTSAQQKVGHLPVALLVHFIQLYMSKWPCFRIYTGTQRSRSVLTMLSRHRAEITSSHATHQGTLVHSRLSSLSHCGLILAQAWTGACELISTLEKNARRGLVHRILPPASPYAR